MTAEPIDVPMGDAPDADAGPEVPPEPLLLSDDEARLLALYDQLRALRLEAALLRARQAFGTADASSTRHAPDAAAVAAAQDAVLEARAAYVLRNEVVDSVLTVNPILRAVHQATRASPVERDLLPAVEQRDGVSRAVAQTVAAQRAVRDERITTMAACRETEQRNARRAAQMRALLAAETADDAADAADPAPDGNSRTATATAAAAAAAAAERAQLEADVKASRQRWRLIKGAASAIVAGSGVDWARDAALRDMVLDPE